jgi:hypothetical protein
MRPETVSSPDFGAKNQTELASDFLNYSGNDNLVRTNTYPINSRSKHAIRISTEGLDTGNGAMAEYSEPVEEADPTSLWE